MDDRRILQNGRSLLLGANETLASVQSTRLYRGGELTIEVDIDNGADDVAPTDTPSGSWKLYVSAEQEGRYRLYSNATIDAELAKIAPNANNVVAAWANLAGVPSVWAKLLYVRNSGGATTRARVRMVTS